MLDVISSAFGAVSDMWISGALFTASMTCLFWAASIGKGDRAPRL